MRGKRIAAFAAAVGLLAGGIGGGIAAGAGGGSAMKKSHDAAMKEQGAAMSHGAAMSAAHMTG
jgi:hypothetical protein